tara:strand:+ start:581 stop:1153 length:573 start_codon:yes stop_codon:yes gene_type:complete
LKIVIKNCSQCGSDKINFTVPQGDNRERYVCQSCGFIHYQNPNIVAGSILEWDNKVLLCKRAIEPRINCWTLPAGFLENEESLEAGAARECEEEAHALSDDMRIFSIYSLVHISQIYVMYYGTLKDGKHSPGLEESFDTKLYSKEDIPWDELAFPVITENLKLFYENGKPDRPHTGSVDKINNDYIITRN